MNILRKLAYELIKIFFFFKGRGHSGELLQPTGIFDTKMYKGGGKHKCLSLDKIYTAKTALIEIDKSQ